MTQYTCQQCMGKMHLSFSHHPHYTAVYTSSLNSYQNPHPSKCPTTFSNPAGFTIRPTVVTRPAQPQSATLRTRVQPNVVPDEGIGHGGGVLVILRGGVGGRRRIKALAAGVEDEGVALIGEAEAAVLVHGSLPGAGQEHGRRDGEGEQAEADGRRGGHEAERWSSEAGSSVSEVEPLLGCARGAASRYTKSQGCCRRGGVRGRR
jgi:hypothetical protein